MSRWSLILLLAFTTGVAVASAPHTVEFGWETQNLPVVRSGFLTEPPIVVTDLCSGLEGEVRYGRLPHRLSDETMVESGHFVGFAAVYAPGSEPVLLLDLDFDRKLDCDERVELVRHPHEAVLFRTVLLEWHDDGPDRSQRYRIKIPATLDERSSYRIDLVDAPVARWTEGGRTSLWLLYDGNHDGLYGGKLGDGILIDPTGSGHLDIDPDGESFFSYYEPITLPWAAYGVMQFDPRGRFLQLGEIEASSLPRPYDVGDLVSETECRSVEGETLRFGGPSDRHQLLFFAVATCGSCIGDVIDLVPLFREIGPERLSITGVSMDENRKGMPDFVEKAGAFWSQCYSGRSLWDNDLARRFEVRDPSGFVVLDPDGRVMARGRGATELRGILEETLLWPMSIEVMDGSPASR